MSRPAALKRLVPARGVAAATRRAEATESSAAMPVKPQVQEILRLEDGRCLRQHCRLVPLQPDQPRKRMEGVQNRPFGVIRRTKRLQVRQHGLRARIPPEQGRPKAVAGMIHKDLAAGEGGNGNGAQPGKGLWRGGMQRLGRFDQATPPGFRIRFGLVTAATVTARSSRNRAISRACSSRSAARRLEPPRSTARMTGGRERCGG